MNYRKTGVLVHVKHGCKINHHGVLLMIIQGLKTKILYVIKLGVMLMNIAPRITQM